MKELTTKKQAKLLYYGTSLVAQTVKASAYNVGDPVSIPGLERFPWRRKRLPTLVFLPGESHGQRTLVGSSPWGHKELDMTKRLSLFTEKKIKAGKWVSKC